MVCVLLFVKHETSYDMRISDWSSDVCSSDLIWSLLRASDPLLFNGDAAKVTLAESLELRKVIGSLEAMSQEEFARAMGHRTLHIATHKLVKNDLVLLTQRVAFEAGIDLFPSRWHIAADSARRDFWEIGRAHD